MSSSSVTDNTSGGVRLEEKEEEEDGKDDQGVWDEGTFLAFENIVEAMKSDPGPPNDGKFLEALNLSQEVITMTKNNINQKDNYFALTTLQGVVAIMEHYKQFAETMTLYQDLLELTQKLFGQDHADTLSIQQNIDQMTQATQTLDGALDTHQKMWEARKLKLETDTSAVTTETPGWNLVYLFDNKQNGVKEGEDEP